MQHRITHDPPSGSAHDISLERMRALRMATKTPSDRAGMAMLLHRQADGCHCGPQCQPSGAVATTIVSIDARLAKQLFWLLVFAAVGTANGALHTPGQRSLLPSMGGGVRSRARTVRMDFDDASSDSWASFSAALCGSARLVARTPHPVVMRGSALLLEDDAAGSAKATRAARATPSTTKPERIYSSAELRQRLSRPDGTPTMLVFAAKSCRACRAVMPKMERLAARHGARLLSVYHEPATEAAFAELEVSETPTTHLYDGNGALVSRDVVCRRKTCRGSVGCCASWQICD